MSHHLISVSATLDSEQLFSDVFDASKIDILCTLLYSDIDGHERVITHYDIDSCKGSEEHFDSSQLPICF